MEMMIMCMIIREAAYTAKLIRDFVEWRMDRGECRIS